MSGTHGMVAHLAGFGGALREHGIRVSLDDEVDAATALTLIDLLDRPEVHRALRIAFKVPHDAWAVFDRLFDWYWGGGASRRAAPQHEALRDHRGPPAWSWDGRQVRLAAGETPEAPTGEIPGYSPQAVLRRKPFDQLSASEIAAMERLLSRLALRLATRRSRRLVPVRGRGIADIRRSFRRALATDGEVLSLARRARALEEPRLVVLCDTSGSMDSYTRFFLTFAFALRRAVRRVEIFAFNTSLVRVTRMIAPARMAHSLERLAGGVPDWSGGTRIGACLAAFATEYADTLVDRNTTVVVLSDGLDHGDTALLAGAMQELRGRAARIVWLNPLLGDPRYRPEAAGMRAALPYVDHFGAAHNLESLERLLRVLA